MKKSCSNNTNIFQTGTRNQLCKLKSAGFGYFDHFKREDQKRKQNLKTVLPTELQKNYF